MVVPSWAFLGSLSLCQIWSGKFLIDAYMQMCVMITFRIFEHFLLRETTHAIVMYSRVMHLSCCFRIIRETRLSKPTFILSELSHGAYNISITCKMAANGLRKSYAMDVLCSARWQHYITVSLGFDAREIKAAYLIREVRHIYYANAVGFQKVSEHFYISSKSKVAARNLILIWARTVSAWKAKLAHKAIAGLRLESAFLSMIE
jgi:hypothetical protein